MPSGRVAGPAPRLIRPPPEPSHISIRRTSLCYLRVCEGSTLRRASCWLLVLFGVALAIVGTAQSAELLGRNNTTV